MTLKNPYNWGLGRRKSSVARVRIKSGSGSFLINGREVNDYFPALQDQVRAFAPLRAIEAQASYDVWATVKGGGPSGQAGAVMLGLARALRAANPVVYEVLRQHHLLTRDSRMKERKKPGRRAARRGFQFSKR
jgi:small subunit ribosomal protein S9